MAWEHNRLLISCLSGVLIRAKSIEPYAPSADVVSQSLRFSLIAACGSFVQDWNLYFHLFLLSSIWFHHFIRRASSSIHVLLVAITSSVLLSWLLWFLPALVADVSIRRGRCDTRECHINTHLYLEEALLVGFARTSQLAYKTNGETFRVRVY